MKIGILGLPLVGKTTFFNLLTEMRAATKNFMDRSEKLNIGMAKVLDSRIDKLSNIFEPEKITYAKIEFADLPGLSTEQNNKERNSFLSNLKNMDALVQVVRVFDNQEIPLAEDELDPVSELEKVNLELIFSDLEIIERKFSRVKKGQKVDPHEMALLEKCQSALEEGKSIRELDLAKDDLAKLRGYTFLTAKPLIIVLNLSEEQFQSGRYEDRENILEFLENNELPYLEICAALEMEINELEPEEKGLFMDELGIKETGIARLARTVYQHLDLISFFTVGTDEVRAWTITRGMTAKEAAGVIHSDIARGFIKAEVIAYDRFIELGSLQSAREAGELRIEGKEYLVSDGDIISYRFNV